MKEMLSRLVTRPSKYGFSLLEMRVMDAACIAAGILFVWALHVAPVAKM